MKENKNFSWCISKLLIPIPQVEELEDVFSDLTE
jgi:hypothetical protein